MQTIERTFAVLRAVADQPRGAGVSEVARTARLPKSTVHRILASLEGLGIVDHDSGSYSIGAGLASLTGAVNHTTSLRELCRPYLRDLVDQFEESAGLTVEEGRTALYLDQISSLGPVRTKDWTGSRLPLHTVAGGLAIMMTWPQERIADYVQGGLPAASPAAAASGTDLMDRLIAAQRTGHVWTLGDFDVEIHGVGAPILDETGAAIGAISSYGPSYRFPGDRDAAAIGAAVAEIAATVGERLRA